MHNNCIIIATISHIIETCVHTTFLFFFPSSSRSSPSPSVPYIGPYLNQLVSIEVGMPTFVRDPPEHVNFSKLSKVNNRLILTYDMIIPVYENSVSLELVLRSSQLFNVMCVTLNRPGDVFSEVGGEGGGGWWSMNSEVSYIYDGDFLSFTAWSCDRGVNEIPKPQVQHRS